MGICLDKTALIERDHSELMDIQTVEQQRAINLERFVAGKLHELKALSKEKPQNEAQIRAVIGYIKNARQQLATIRNLTNHVDIVASIAGRHLDQKRTTDVFKRFKPIAKRLAKNTGSIVRELDTMGDDNANLHDNLMELDQAMSDAVTTPDIDFDMDLELEGILGEGWAAAEGSETGTEEQQQLPLVPQGALHSNTNSNSNSNRRKPVSSSSSTTTTLPSSKDPYALVPRELVPLECK